MNADKDGDQYLVQNFLLAHDYFAHLTEDIFTHSVEAFDTFLECGCVLIQSGKRSHRFGSFSSILLSIVSTQARASAPDDSQERFRARPADYPRPCPFVPRQSRLVRG